MVLPVHPVLESVVYGGVDERDDKLHHVTVLGGWERYVFTNVLHHSGIWGHPVAEQAQSNPVKFQQTVNKVVDRYVDSFISQGYREDQILIELYDEPADGAGDDGAAWAELAKAIKRYRPELRIIANPLADYEGASVKLDRTFRPLAPYVDVWMPYYAHYDNPEVREFLRSTGKPLWFYKNTTIQDGRREKGCTGFLRRAGWIGVKYDLDGIGFWSASAYYGDPWDDFDGALGWPDGAVVFPSEAGPITTRQWEAWRETLEDAAIYKMVQHALAAGVVPAERRETARKWLEESPDVILRMEEGSGILLRRVLDRALDILAALQGSSAQRQEPAK